MLSEDNDLYQSFNHGEQRCFQCLRGALLQEVQPSRPSDLRILSSTDLMALLIPCKTGVTTSFDKTKAFSCNSRTSQLPTQLFAMGIGYPHIPVMISCPNLVAGESILLLVRDKCPEVLASFPLPRVFRLLLEGSKRPTVVQILSSEGRRNR